MWDPWAFGLGWKWLLPDLGQLLVSSHLATKTLPGGMDYKIVGQQKTAGISEVFQQVAEIKSGILLTRLGRER